MTEKLTIKYIEDKLLNMSIKDAINYLNNLSYENPNLNLNRLIEKYDKKNIALLKEYERYDKLCKFENNIYGNGFSYIAGVDEAGRGPLAGPVVAASVVLPKDIFIAGIDDSKKLSELKRDKLFNIITQKAVCYKVGIINEKEIDSINILNATKKAMAFAVMSLTPLPSFILVDAEKINGIEIPQLAIVKGDSLSVSIAAASIVAKVTRDKMMIEFDSIYPQYGFGKHKGYGTNEHIQAIKKYGPCPIHRLSFIKNFI